MCDRETNFTMFNNSDLTNQTNVNSSNLNESIDSLDGYTCPELSINDRILLEAVSYWVEGVLQTGVATIGILSNLVKIFDLFIVNFKCRKAEKS